MGLQLHINPLSLVAIRLSLLSASLPPRFAGLTMGLQPHFNANFHNVR